ncbi:MAG TPA: sigma-70 family RNA polymerase sigma factor [Gammaproteobacteria bacterium]|nr:sigma-70 family RNA polymerase sigma factor [Gammaproteobacteria bacterium]
MNQHVHVEHVFRHEYGLLVATLSRRVGMQHVDIVEDAVQHAMMQALEFWCRDDIPENPSAWLHQVAYRQLLSAFRITKRRNALLAECSVTDDNESFEQPAVPLPGEMSDSLLRMLFVTCNDTIPVESQLVFTLKSLCGFSIREIALRLFITEENAYKRFSRARQHLKNTPVVLDTLTDSDMEARLSMVHRVLYLVFTEGYLSSHADTAIRMDLCVEAIRLVQLILESSFGDTPETNALLALLYLHLARMNARQDTSGELLLFEQQDRTEWDEQCIFKGLGFLERSAQGGIVSRYHVEASIAAEHCLAPSFKQTRWDKIVRSYEILEHIAPSALHGLNRAVAMAEWQGPGAGLAVLQSLNIPGWLDRSYHWHAVHADLQYRCGDVDLARDIAEQAIKSAPTDDIKRLLYKRLGKCGLSSQAG